MGIAGPAASPGLRPAHDTDLRLGTTILWCVGIACAAIVFLYAWQTWASWDSVDRAATRQTVNLAQSLAQQTESSFQTTDAVLQRMYFWASTRGVQGPVERQLLRDLLSVRTPSMSAISGLGFFDAGGHAVVWSGPRGGSAQDASAQTAFRYHATHASLDPYVGEPAPVGQADATIGISRRFNDRQGRFAGMVLAQVTIAAFRPLFASVNVGRRGTVLLVLNDGTIVLRKPFDLSLIGVNRRHNQIVPRSQNAASGSYTSRSIIDGENRLTAFQRVEHFPLIVIVAISVAETFAAWTTATIIGLIGVCVILVTIVILTRALLEALRRSARTQAQLADFALRDGLTGLSNRREFDAAIEREWRRGRRDTSTLSLIMIDADLFKTYNDRYGHQLGDEVLRSIAACLRQACSRTSDIVARYGGEEFAVLLPSTTLEGARQLAERVRASLLERGIVHADNPSGFVTISMGVASAVPDGINSSSELVRVADGLLYEAKRLGRNRIESSVVKLEF